MFRQSLMPRTKERIWMVVMLMLAVSLTVYTLSYLVTEPWHALPGLSGDSAKNNYSYLYQIIYGRGFHFDGMHYPYGDNIVFADGQASLSVILSYFKGITVGQALTILWWLVGLSYVLSMVFIYKTLLHFKVSYPVACIFACLIGMLSPQLVRIGAHYGLSYICVLPMLFYWTIRYHELQARKYCIYIFVLGLFATFLHPYFSAIVLVWVLSYAGGYIIFTRQATVQKLKHLWPILGSAVAVLATTAIIMKITDPVTDRPATPYGLLAYISRIEDVYTSANSPIWQYLSEHNMFTRVFDHISKSEGNEGYAYIGVVAALAVLYSLLVGIYARVVKDRERIVVRNDLFAPIWLFMGIAALLFSMGIPYIWHIDWLLDRFTFMKQFRSLGRFTWIFYYIITIYAAVVIYRRFAGLRLAGRSVDAYIVLLLAVFVWGREEAAYLQKIRSNTRGGLFNFNAFLPPADERWNAFLGKHNHSGKDFQAVLILPFFHVGTDKLWVDDPGWKMTLASIACFQLHLPMVDALMARTSWSQTFKMVKMAAGPFVSKPMLNDLHGSRPLLLLSYDQQPLNPDQKYLLEASDYIGHFSQCDAYSFYPERQVANDRKNADSIRTLLPLITNTDTCIGNVDTWCVKHFDNGAAKNIFWGQGALPSISGHDSIVAEIAVNPVRDSQLYELSAWFLLNEKDPNAPYIIIQSLDSAGNQLKSDDLLVKSSVDNEGMWFRGSVYFRMLKNCRTVRCKLVCEVIPSYITMDELLLRPADALIISKLADGSVLVNNHLFKKKGGAK